MNNSSTLVYLIAVFQCLAVCSVPYVSVPRIQSDINDSPPEANDLSNNQNYVLAKQNYILM